MPHYEIPYRAPPWILFKLYAAGEIRARIWARCDTPTSRSRGKIGDLVGKSYALPEELLSRQGHADRNERKIETTRKIVTGLRGGELPEPGPVEPGTQPGAFRANRVVFVRCSLVGQR